jgi:phosphoglucomutase
MDQTIEARIKEWLSDDYDAGTRKEIQTLLDKNDEKELVDRFYTELEFGTAGLRGTLGAGANRMNIYNVRKATQGLANYIIRNSGQRKGILIGRDSRILSDRFAEETASVMIANGIKVYYFQDIHPTPTVSFGLRHLKAISGVMITASHNPKEYNGYKVLWEDGAQITPPHDGNIIEEVRKITSLSQVKFISFQEAKQSPLFETADHLIDRVYLEKVKSLSVHPEVIRASGIKICYSPLYGTGYRLVPESLRGLGFKDVVMVEEQSTPDGNFPTAPYPNPEEPSAMAVGMKFAKERNADIFIATDPDADRIGVMLKKPDGDFALLNGNQIATLLVYYIASQLAETKKMPVKPRIISTIVTTGLLADIAESFGIKLDEVLTGFKWIGFKMNEYEKEGLDFVFGCEESHGYLAGTFVRDKDAVIGASLIAELAAFYKSRGTSAYEILQEIYRKYSYYRESQKSITMKGQDGAEQIKALMEKIRRNPPAQIGRFDLLFTIDLETGKIFDQKTGQVTGKWNLPSSNVIILRLSEKAKIIARPSGTEPKIKFYCTTSGRVKEGESLDSLEKRVNQEHEELKVDFLALYGLDG